MAVVLWVIVALGLAFLVILVAAYQSRTIYPPIVLPAGESMPATPLQRAVRWSLAIAVPVILLAGGLVAWFGPVDYADDDPVRLTVTFLFIVALFVLAAPTFLAGFLGRGPDARLDERDRAILARAPAGQAVAMILVLMAWTIALQEAFRGEPGIPTTFLYLIDWSCLLVSLLVSNLGILIGYRRT